MVEFLLVLESTRKWIVINLLLIACIFVLDIVVGYDKGVDLNVDDASGEKIMEKREYSRKMVTLSEDFVEDNQDKMKKRKMDVQVWNAIFSSKNT